MFGVQNVSPNMFWDFSAGSAILVSNWLRAKRGLLWMRKKEKEKEKKRMMVLTVQSLRREFVDLWVAQPCLWVPE